MATKKDELDYTKQPQATTQEEVDAQDSRTRLYQSLGYSYGQQQEQSDKAYNQAISQQDRALLSRGMQRSSYGMNTLANLQNQKVKERNRIGEAFIADYQSRLAQQEEAEAARQFQTSEREAQQAWQSAENALNREQEEAQFADQMAFSREQLAQNQSQFDIQQAFNERQWEAQQEQWREQFDYGKMSDAQKLAYNYIAAAAANGGDVSDSLLAQAGISREDYNAMKTQAKSSGGRGYTPKPGTGNGEESGDKSGILTQEQLESLAGAGGKTATAASSGSTMGVNANAAASRVGATTTTPNWAYIVGTRPVSETEEPEIKKPNSNKSTK